MAPTQVRGAHDDTAIDVGDAGYRHGDAHDAATGCVDPVDRRPQLLREDRHQIVEGRGLAAQRATPLVHRLAGQVVGDHPCVTDIDLHAQRDHPRPVQLQQRRRPADSLIRLGSHLLHQPTLDQVGDQAGDRGARETGDRGHAGTAARALRGEQPQHQREVVATNVEMLDRGVGAGWGTGHGADCSEVRDAS